MKTLCICYLIIYTIYLLLGYNFLTRIYKSKQIDFINNSPNSYSYFPKRFLQLSLITLIVCSICFWSKDINWYCVSLLLSLVVIIFYYILFNPIKDWTTYIFHIIWALPIFFLPLFCEFNGKFDYRYLIISVILLLLYKILLSNYVYF